MLALHLSPARVALWPSPRRAARPQPQQHADHRLRRDRRRSALRADHAPIERLILKTREHPFAGAQVGIDEAAGAGRGCSTPTSRSSASRSNRPTEVAPAVHAGDGGARHPFLPDRRAGRGLQAAGGGGAAAATCCCSTSAAPDDSLRRELCARGVRAYHAEPRHAHGRADAIPGVAQMARLSWCCEGPRRPTPRRTKAFERSAQKFGARIVAHQHFKPGTDPREREQNDPALLSAISRDYDVVFVADDAFDFVRTVPYHTVRPRPVVGSIDLEPVAWHWTWEHNGAPQVNSRFDKKLRRPPHGGRRLGRLDRGEDDRAVGAAHPLDRFRQAARLHPRRRQLRRRQGPAGRGAAVGPPGAAGGAAGRAL